MSAKPTSNAGLSEKDFSRWKLLADFRERLELAGKETQSPPGREDPRRLLSHEDYLCLLLFGLFNPVVESMRGLCAASHLRRVQEDVCSHPVSLGSFSEAQAVVDPELLRKVFEQLGAGDACEPWGERRLEPYRKVLMAVDSTLWRALPRMAWAIWRYQHGRESALRMHIKFNILEQKPVQVHVTPARRCERSVLREHLEKGEFYVGDRNYGEDYGLFAEMKQQGCSFVMRLRGDAAVRVLEEFPLSPEDRQAGVISDARVELGTRNRDRSVPLRLVRILGEEEQLLLVTDKDREELSAGLIALIYRYRWQVELFFKWIKCILGCRHWLAQSPRGVALQVYCALIAALLLQRYTRRRPGKRAMEMIRFYLLGYAGVDELCCRLGIEKNQA